MGNVNVIGSEFPSPQDPQHLNGSDDLKILGVPVSALSTLVRETVLYGNVLWLCHDLVFRDALVSYLTTTTDPVSLHHAISYYQLLHYIGLNKLYFNGQHLVLLYDHPLYHAATTLWLRNDRTRNGSYPIRQDPAAESVMEYCAVKTASSEGAIALKQLCEITGLSLFNDDEEHQVLSCMARMVDTDMQPYMSSSVSEDQLKIRIKADGYHLISAAAKTNPAQLGMLLLERWKSLSQNTSYYSIMLTEQLKPLIQSLRAMSVFDNLDPTDYQWLTTNNWKGFEGWDTFTIRQRRLAILTPTQLWYLSGLPFAQYQDSDNIIDTLRKKLETVDIEEWVTQRLTDAQRELDTMPDFVVPGEVYCEENVLCNKHDSYGPFDRYVLWNDKGTHRYFFTREDFETLISKKTNFYTNQPISCYHHTMLQVRLITAEKYQFPKARPLRELWDEMLDPRCPHPFAGDQKKLDNWCKKYLTSPSSTPVFASAYNSQDGSNFGGYLRGYYVHPSTTGYQSSLTGDFDSDVATSVEPMAISEVANIITNIREEQLNSTGATSVGSLHPLDRSLSTYNIMDDMINEHRNRYISEAISNTMTLIPNVFRRLRESVPLSTQDQCPATHPSTHHPDNPDVD